MSMLGCSFVVFSFLQFSGTVSLRREPIYPRWGKYLSSYLCIYVHVKQIAVFISLYIFSWLVNLSLKFKRWLKLEA